jgi:tRNA threonylcarbamoyl adenosine modification protein (Sua5/YciO/YrdC/YwlC family)
MSTLTIPSRAPSRRSPRSSVAGAWWRTPRIPGTRWAAGSGIATVWSGSDRHHFTLVCSEFAQLGQYVQMDNDVFRAVKAATPGPYTFILKATREAPKVMLHPKKKTVGVRIPKHTTTLALLKKLGEPLMSSTLILPGEEFPMTEGWLVKDELDASVDAVLDSGDCGLEPTTIVEFTDEGAEILRVGAGDPSPFEA